MRKSFSERFNIESNNNWAIFRKISLVLVVVALLMFVITGCGSKEEVIEDNSVDIMQELPKSNVNVIDDGVSAAIAGDDIEIVPSSQMQPGMVTMSLDDVGRRDPFLPSGSNSISTLDYEYSQSLLPPPQSITVDTTATEVIGTRVSGIMFDAFNPSAIINISGSDYLVRTGDVINGYKVLAIAKEIVTVQNGQNVYKAGVGELFTGDGITHNTVSNLEEKFGGSKNVVNMEKF